MPFEKLSQFTTASGPPAPTNFIAGANAGSPNQRYTAGQIAQSINKYNNIINVKDYGAVGNGVTDDTTAIQTALNAGGAILFDGTFNITSTLNLSGSNISLIGIPGSSIVSSTIYNLINFSGTSSSILFQDLIFNSTVTVGSETFSGLITCNGVQLTNIYFNRCAFTIPNAVANGVKLINQGAPTTQSVFFDYCNFHDINRMGIEIQNNAGDTVHRYFNVVVENSTFKNIGPNNGFGVSFTGRGDRNLVRDCHFTSCIVGIEFAGTSNSTLENNSFDSMTSSGNPIAMTNTIQGFNNCLINNNFTDQTGGQTQIYTQVNLYSSGNLFQTGGGPTFRDIQGWYSVGDKFITAGVNAFYIEGTAAGPSYAGSFNNTIIGAIFDNSASGGNFSTARTFGNTTNTTFVTCTFKKGSGGVFYDGAGGAETPNIDGCEINGTYTIAFNSGYFPRIGASYFLAQQVTTFVPGLYTGIIGDVTNSWRVAVALDGSDRPFIGFGTGALSANTYDSGVARSTAHVVEINSGAYGAGPGVILPQPSTFANLPASPVQGMMCSITDGLAGNCADGSCTTFGTNVTGGTGALKLNLWYNGTHWTLIGK